MVIGARLRDWRKLLMIARLASLSVPPAFFTRPAGRSWLFPSPSRSEPAVMSQGFPDRNETMVAS
jgi:hypothetical protein